MDHVATDFRRLSPRAVVRAALTGADAWGGVACSVSACSWFCRLPDTLAAAPPASIEDEREPDQSLTMNVLMMLGISQLHQPLPDHSRFAC